MSAERKPSGPIRPTAEFIAENLDQFDLTLEEVLIVPKIHVRKDGKLVNIINETSLRYYTGTLNPQYADQFVTDMINDFRIGFVQALRKHKAELQEKYRNLKPPEQEQPAEVKENES